jgi:hypothetical protein
MVVSLLLPQQPTSFYHNKDDHTLLHCSCTSGTTLPLLIVPYLLVQRVQRQNGFPMTTTTEAALADVKHRIQLTA